MNEDVQQLIGHQVAEFNLATRYFLSKFLLQLCTVAVAVSSVLTLDSTSSYWLAIVSFVLALGWAASDIKYRSIRTCAERARRATLIMGGLGKKISSNELNNIRECLASSEASGKKLENPDYFVTKAAPGTVRLAELLEESAFWTLDLQRTSAAIMWSLFVIVIILAGGSLFFLIPDTPNEQLMKTARVVCVGLSFAVGADLFGTARGYSTTAKTLDRLLHRFDSAKARNYPEPDMLLMLSDYNAAVENTPLNLPFTYRLRRQRLTKNWERRQADIDKSR